MVDTKQIYDVAGEIVGTPFKWEGRNKDGLDCVGVVFLFFEKLGIKIHNTDGEHYKEGWWKENPQRFIREVLLAGEIIDINKIQPLDILCFEIGGVMKHIGVYLEYGKFLHCYSHSVGIGRLEGIWRRRLMAGVRVKHS